MEATRKATILNQFGFHVRPTTMFVETAKTFDCNIEVALNGNSADGKSAMSMLGLGAVQGNEIEIRCQGDDAEAACEALGKLVDERFGGIE